MRLLLTFSTALLLSASIMYAQDELTNKNGHAILPAAGDYCISMDGAPLFDFALNAINIMNNTGQTANHPGFVLPNTIVGKYFVQDSLAYRGTISIVTSSSTDVTFYDDPNDTSADPAEISDKVNNKSCDVVLSAGREYRRGYNRLQGLYGAEALLGYSNSKSKNTYGIAAEDALSWVGSSRILSTNTGAAISIGARAFIGAEYFFAPKISLGAEFGWGIGIMMGSRGNIVMEVNDNNNIVEEVSTNSTNSSGFGFSVDSGSSPLMGSSAQLKLNLHF